MKCACGRHRVERTGFRLTRDGSHSWRTCTYQGRTYHAGEAGEQLNGWHVLAVMLIVYALLGAFLWEVISR